MWFSSLIAKGWSTSYIFQQSRCRELEYNPPPMAQKPKKVPVWLGTLAHLLFRQQVIFCNNSSRLRVSEPKSQVAFRFISPTSRSFTGWFAYKSSRLRISSPTSHLAYRPIFAYKQELITRSLHTNCTLESTLSRIFLFLELRYVGGSLISRENTLTFA